MAVTAGRLLPLPSLAGGLRPATSGGQTRPGVTLPVIEHPGLQLGASPRLCVDGAQTRLTLGARSLTDLTPRRAAARAGALTPCGEGDWSLGAPAGGATPRQTRSTTPNSLVNGGKFRRVTGSTPGYVAEELTQMLSDKLANGSREVKHLFLSNGSSGNGTVTKEGILRVFYSLFGYIHPEQFHDFLKRHGFDKYNGITFEQFLAHFKHNNTEKPQWVSPCQKIDIKDGDFKRNPDPRNRIPGPLCQSAGIDASKCHSRLKKKLGEGGFDIQSTLWPDGHVTGERIFPDHLRQLLDLAGLDPSDDVFARLWDRYDRDGLGAASTSHFFKAMGLDSRGRPMASVAPPTGGIGNSSRGSHSREKKLESIDENGTTITPDTSNEGQEAPVNDPSAKNGRRQLISRQGRGITAYPLEDIMHALHFKFEQPYQSMMMALQSFDFLEDDHVARIDFKRILEEFGLHISSIELEHFFTRISVRCRRGQVPYKEFLLKYWNKSDTGLVHRIMTSRPHILTGGTTQHAEILAAQELESRLALWFHESYFSLLNQFKQFDRHQLGVVTPYHFKDALNMTLGVFMNENQWKQLMSLTPTDKCGLVCYQKFMGIFQTREPGLWNKTDICGVSVKRVHPEITQEVKRLQQLTRQEEEARRMCRAQDGEESGAVGHILNHAVTRVQNELNKMATEKNGRSLQEIEMLLRELFDLKYPDLDKEFRALDRKMTGRFNKQQFTLMMKRCGFALTSHEAELLWVTFPLSADGMATFAGVTCHVTGRSMGHNYREREDDSGPVNKSGLEFHGKYSFAYHNVPQDSDKTFGEVKGEVQYVHNKPYDGDRSRSLPDRLRQPDGTSDRRHGAPRNALLAQLVGKEKAVRRALKAADTTKGGFLSVTLFKSVLGSCGLWVDEEQLFHLLNDLDPDLEGKIYYGLFLSKMASSIAAGGDW